MKIKTEIEIDVEIPSVPNYLKLANGETVSISYLDDMQLREIAKLWGDELIIKARAKRKRDKRA